MLATAPVKGDTREGLATASEKRLGQLEQDGFLLVAWGPPILLRGQEAAESSDVLTACDLQKMACTIKSGKS